MTDILIVSNQNPECLLEDSKEDYSVEFDHRKPYATLERSPPLPSRVIVVDLATCHRVNELLQKIKEPPAAKPIALVTSQTLKQMGELLERDVKIFLESPISPDTLKEATRAIEQDRRHVDPALSDSIVEEYIK